MGESRDREGDRETEGEGEILTVLEVTVCQGH